MGFRKIPILAIGLAGLLTAAGPGRAQPADPDQTDREVPSEEALWRSAGDTYETGTDKSAALKQYRLFVSTYGRSDRAARGQFMVGECLFVMEDYVAALEAYEDVPGRGRDDLLEASLLLRLGECHFNLGQFEKAFKEFDRCLDKYSKSFQAGETLFSLGETLIAQERWSRLDEIYKRLLDTRPAYGDREDVKFALGLIAYHDGRFDEAIVHFEGVESDRGLFFWGRALEDDGQFFPAVQKYRQLLKKYSDSPLADDAGFAAADAFFKAGQLKLAIEAYESFLERWSESPFYPNALYKLAAVSFREGRYEDAVRSLEIVREQYAQEEIRAYADYLIGNCHLELGNVPEATFAYTRVLEEFSNSRVASAALHKMVFCYANNANHAQALLLAEDFQERFPGDPLAGRVHLLKGFALRELGDMPKAIREFQAVLDKHPSTDLSERALALATLSWAETGQYDRMITTYRHLADGLLPTENPWRARTYYRLGDAYYALGLYQDANQMYRLVLTGYPRSNVAAYALQGLTASYAQMGQYELALEEQERFLMSLTNAESKNGRNQLASASIHFNKRNYEESLESYQRFLREHPDDPAAPGAMIQSGDAYYRLQYYEDAIQTWHTLLERFPQDPRVPEALYKIADTEFGLGRFDRATQSYRALLARAPYSEYAADAAFNIGNCYYNLRDDGSAIEAFQAFMSEFPDDDRFDAAEQAIQSAFYRSGRSVEEFMASNPESPLVADLLWQEGQEAFAAESYVVAADRFRQVALEYPESNSAANAVFYLGEAHYRGDDLDEALATYRNFVGTYPENDLAPLAGFRIGVTQFKLEEFEKSVEAFEDVLREHPTSEYAAMSAYNVTLALSRLEDWPAYVEACQRLADRYPDHERRAEMLLQIAVVQQDEMGEYALAVDSYGRAIGSEEAPLTEIAYRMGECHVKLDQLEEALAAFDQADRSGEAADPFRIAALAKAAELHEKRSEWDAALAAYRAIATAGGKPEWTEMAEAKIAAVEERVR